MYFVYLTVYVEYNYKTLPINYKRWSSMVELKTKMTKSGVLYIPKEIREAFGRELVILPNSCAVLMFRRGLKYKHALSSLKIIAADLKHRIVMEAEKHDKINTQR